MGFCPAVEGFLGDEVLRADADGRNGLVSGQDPEIAVLDPDALCCIRQPKKSSV